MKLRKIKRTRINREKKANYEWGIVILLSTLFGIAIMNRLAIVYLFPSMISEFKINYAQAGALTSILAITSAFSIWFFGILSDRIGRKIILIPATIFFSFMSWVSGLTHCFSQMLFARGLMGIGQGAVLPTSIATIAAESTPSRRGFNFGLHQALTPIISIGIGAVIVTQLTQIMSWRMVFFVVGLPGVILSIILYLYMDEPEDIRLAGKNDGSDQLGKKPSFYAPMRYKNVIISSIVNSLMMGCLFVFFTFGMVYFVNERQLSISDSGIIMSLLGLTASLGCILLPLLSDRVGRKPIIIPSLFITGLSFCGIIVASANFFLLSLFASIGGFATGGVGPIAVSALTTECVPPDMAAAASGIPASIGEIFGSALMPFLAGFLCDLWGIKTALLFSAAAPLIAGFVGFFYKETAPKIIARELAMIPPVST